MSSFWVRFLLLVTVFLLPAALFFLFPDKPREADAFEYTKLISPSEVKDPVTVSELVKGVSVIQPLIFDATLVKRLASLRSNETLCVDLLMANYSNRGNKGYLDIGLRQHNVTVSARIDVGQVTDNAFERICLENQDWDGLQPGEAELFIEGVDGEAGSSITAWLTSDLRGKPASTNGVPSTKGLVYGLVIREWLSSKADARLVFVLVYMGFVGLLLWRLAAMPKSVQESGEVSMSKPVRLPLSGPSRGEVIGSSDCAKRVLFIQIPCYNEAESLAVALGELPREVPGFDRVEWLVIDDGSQDDTVRIARELGVDHIIRHSCNRGLARAFMSGLDACVRLGADVIVNTDADNQYQAADIPALVEPILDGRAEIVIGARPIEVIRHFSPIKKFLQRLGSWAVRVASRTDIPDAPSGFRAMTREAAHQMMVFNDYTYTLETIIQAGQKNMAITSVPIRVNPDLRPSRLVRSIPSYISRSVMTIIRIFVIYRPFRTFALIGGILFAAGGGLGIRYLYFFMMGHGDGHVQSLILASILLGMGFQTLLVAFVADLLAANRKLLEDIRFTQKCVRGGWKIVSDENAQNG